jgi:aryl-alcohol dehydrogenase-like predicted oxidoreductase
VRAGRQQQGALVQYATLGDTGLIVSRLAFGAATFTQGNKDMGTFAKVGEALAAELVGMALDQGVNSFDTADGYANGESEVLLGRALGARRADVVLSTKVGFRTGTPLGQQGLSRRHILWSIDQSLRRLGTDWIDVYIVHREDPHTALEETVSALDAVVRAGKARYVGFSNWSAWKVAAALELQRANGLARFTHGQMYHSLVGRDYERDFPALQRRYGIGMTVWSPLAGGFLSGKYTPENLRDPEYRYSGFDVLPFDKEHGFRVVELLRAIAARRDASVPQVAIAWLLAKPFVTSVLLGATKLRQLVDNLGASDLLLTPDDVAELDGATALGPAYPNWFIDEMADTEVRAALQGTSAR